MRSWAPTSALVAAVFIAGCGGGGTHAATAITITVGLLPDDVAVGGGAVWVTNGASRAVSRIDEANNSVRAIDVGNSPAGVPVGGGFVWVTLAGENAVVRIDPASNQVSGAAIPVGHEPLGIAFGAGAVWVVNDGDATVSRIDPSSASVMATIHLQGTKAFRIAAGVDSVWVPEIDQGLVARIDPVANAITDQIPVAPWPTGVAVGDGAVWITSQGNVRTVDLTVHQRDPVSRIDLRTNSVQSYPVGSIPVAAATSAGQLCVVFSGSTAAARLDPATGRILESVDTGTNSEAVAVGDGSVWVVHPWAAGVKSTEGKPGTVTRIMLWT